MKKPPLLILIGLLAVCTPIAGIMLIKTPQRFTPHNESIGEKLVARFAATDVQDIRIATTDDEALLNKTATGWVVSNRADYPIDNAAEIDRLVESILRLKVGLEIPAKDSHYAEIGLLSPDDTEKAEKYIEARKKEGEKNPADPRGMLITMKNGTGGILASLILGPEFGGEPGQPIRGLLLRSLSGKEGVWKVVGGLNRRTGDPSGGGDVRRGPLSEAKSWLSYDFLSVKKAKSIALSAPSDPEFKGWTVTRETEEGEFTTPDLKADEEMNTTTTGPFKNLFQNLRFEEVLTAEEATERSDADQARRVVISTFEGFTYTFDFAPLKPAEAEEDENTPPPPSNYVGSVTVEGTVAQTRTKVPDDTEERAKAEDQAHAIRLENLQDKLKREQAYQGRHFEFANFTVSNVLRELTELVQAKTPPTPAPGGPAPAPGAGFPGGRPQAVTPPIAVPNPGEANQLPAPPPITDPPANGSQ